MNKTIPGQVGVARPKVTLMMIMCGIVGAVSAGAVSAAATTDEDVPTTIVRYSPSSLETDQGAKAVYRRLVDAAVQVCPQYGNARFVSDAVRHCREQAIASAVFKINNPRLAAVHAINAKNG